MQSLSEQPLVGEERYVTTRITAAKETTTNIDSICNLEQIIILEFLFFFLIALDLFKGRLLPVVTERNSSLECYVTLGHCLFPVNTAHRYYFYVT